MFNNGMLELMAVGDITYSDGFAKQRRFTDYRVYVARGNTAVRIANVGNDAD